MAVYYSDGSNSTSGRVIQVVHSTDTGHFSTTSSSYTQFQSLNITPKDSNSKIILQSYFCSNFGDSNRFAYVRLVRNSTDIGLGASAGNRQRCIVDISTGYVDHHNVTTRPKMNVFVDSPGTTSTITYRLKVKLTNGGTLVIGRTENGDDGNRSSTVQVFTAMEVSV